MSQPYLSFSALRISFAGRIDNLPLASVVTLPKTGKRISGMAIGGEPPVRASIGSASDAMIESGLSARGAASEAMIESGLFALGSAPEAMIESGLFAWDSACGILVAQPGTHNVTRSHSPPTLTSSSDKTPGESTPFRGCIPLFLYGQSTVSCSCRGEEK